MDPKMAEQKKELINKVVGETKFRTWPCLWAAEQIDILMERYNTSLEQWETPTLCVSNAYSDAYSRFKNVIEIDKAASTLKMALIADIVGLLVGAGFTWLTTSKIINRMAFGRKFKDQGTAALAFFSGNFYNAFKGFPKAALESLSEDVTEAKLLKNIREFDQSCIAPVKFQNNLTISLNQCRDVVKEYLSNLFNKLNKAGMREQESLVPDGNNIFVYEGEERKYGYTENAQLDFIKNQLNKQHDKAIDFIKQLNEHLIQTSFYFREAPDIGAQKDFENKMAIHFERCMWASWIPFGCSKKRMEPVLLSPVLTGTSRNFKGRLPDDFDFSNPLQLQTLQEGYWFKFKTSPHDFDHIKVLRVWKTGRTPGSAIRKRLSELGITKGGQEPQSVPSKIEKLGWVATKSQLKALESWARNYTTSNSASNLIELPHKTRSKDWLTIAQTKNLIDVKSLC